MHKPIGIIGEQLSARAYLQQFLEQNDEILELKIGATIDEVKQLRKFLMHRAMNRRVGIINLLNRLSETHQAILLKIFEELPEYNACFFTSSFAIRMTIKNRCKIIYAPLVRNAELEQMTKKILNEMKNKTFNEKMSRNWRAFLQIQSFYSDGLIDEKEKSVMLIGTGQN